MHKDNYLMNLQARIQAFTKLGEYLKNDFTSEKEEQIYSAKVKNAWFTEESIKGTINAWVEQLNDEMLTSWINPYKLKEVEIPKRVLIIMAGNIPLVGFHDFICAKILNYKCLIKMSSDDKILLPVIIDFLEFISLGFKKNIEFTNKPLKNFDGVIATGSNSSFKYFEYYFKKYPNY